MCVCVLFFFFLRGPGHSRYGLGVWISGKRCRALNLGFIKSLEPERGNRIETVELVYVGTKGLVMKSCPGSSCVGYKLFGNIMVLRRFLLGLCVQF